MAHSDVQHFILTHRFLWFFCLRKKVARLHEFCQSVTHCRCCFQIGHEVLSVVALAVGLYSSNLLYSHKNNFLEAAMKRIASKLHKAVQQLTKREHKESGLYLAGRYTELNLTVAVCEHLHVTGKDVNGFECGQQSVTSLIYKGPTATDLPFSSLQGGYLLCCILGRRHRPAD